MTYEELDPEELLYLAIGEFAVRFERMVELMRAVVTEILEDSGLLNRRMAYATTAKLHAFEIREMLFSLTHEWFEGHPDEIMQRVVDQAMNRIQKLMEHRNLIVHGYATYQSPDEIDASVGVKWAHSKKMGLELKLMPSKSEIRKHSTEGWEVSMLLIIFQSYLQSPSTRAETSKGMALDNATGNYRHVNDIRNDAH